MNWCSFAVLSFCARGETGRHAILRGWWEQSRGSSNLLVRTLPFLTSFFHFLSLEGTGIIPCKATVAPIESSRAHFSFLSAS